jgi:chromosome segregation ATPase
MKKSHRITIPVTVAALTVTSVPFASAFALENSTTVTTDISTTQTARLQALIARGNFLITQRLNTLNRLKAQVAADNRLSDADQATLTTQLDAQITALNTLKAKLDAETTVTAVQADLAQLATNFRTNELIAPKIALLRTIAGVEQALDNLTTTAASLQTQIDTAKTAGRNVTFLQRRLDAANTRIQQAQTRLDSLRSAVLALDSDDFNANPAVLARLRTQLAQVQTRYQLAASDIQTVRVSLFWTNWWF